MRALLVSAVLSIAAACTFPDVDYADAGTGAGSTGGSSSTGTVTTSNSTSSGTTACFVPPSCAADATSCAVQPNEDHKACFETCGTDQQCKNGCDKALQTALGMCAAVCESCTMCKPNKCRALVGL